MTRLLLRPIRNKHSLLARTTWNWRHRILRIRHFSWVEHSERPWQWKTHFSYQLFVVQLLLSESNSHSRLVTCHLKSKGFRCPTINRSEVMVLNIKSHDAPCNHHAGTVTSTIFGPNKIAWWRWLLQVALIRSLKQRLAGWCFQLQTFFRGFPFWIYSGRLITLSTMYIFQHLKLFRPRFSTSEIVLQLWKPWPGPAVFHGKSHGFATGVIRWERCDQHSRWRRLLSRNCPMTTRPVLSI